MRPDMWPPDRAAFFRYWDESLALRTIDEPVRAYFNDLIDLKMTSRPYRVIFGRLHRFTVAALLPQHLRDQMGMSWTVRDERRFTVLLHAISVVWTRLPTVLRAFPLDAYLTDMRLRRRLGMKLV
jgi:uncharacterized protein (DUF2236 family)